MHRENRARRNASCLTPDLPLYPRLFIFTASAVLLLTGLAKIASAMGKAGILGVPDPIFGVPFRVLMLLVGAAELLVGIGCLLLKRQVVSAGLIAWLATNFLVYRIGLHVVGWKGACPCLGTLTGALHISPVIADTVSKVAMIYLAVGASWALFLWRNSWLSSSSPRIVAVALLFISISLGSSAQKSPGPPFMASGTLRYEVFGQTTNEILARGTERFDAHVDGCRWAISATSVPDNGHPEEMSCDGTYTYKKIAGLSPLGSQKNSPVIAAAIKKDVVPFNSGTQIECVWLALASSCYLDTERPGAFSTAWIEVNRTESSLLGDRFSARLSRSSIEPRLPELVECTSNGSVYDRDGSRKSAMPPPFDKGYLSFTYRVLAKTNFGTIELPLVSQFEFFQPALGGENAAAVRRFMHVTLAVEKVDAPVARHSWQPELGNRTRIDDFRFVTARQPGGKITYDVNGSAWPSATAPVVRNARQAVLRNGKAQPIGGEKRMFIIGVMVLVTFGTIVLMVQRSRRPKASI